MNRFIPKKSPTIFVISLLFFIIGYFSSCTHKDQLLPPPAQNSNSNNLNSSSTDLVSLKVTTPPVIDGQVDAVWDKAERLNVVPQVPDPGNGLFSGYVGQSYPVTLRSVYDDKYVYFLAEYDDADKSVFVSTWYFDPATKRWAQEPSGEEFDANGIITRNGFGEDRIAMQWNIDKSTPKFITQTCYASCHIFTPYVDNNGVPVANDNGGAHYTNSASEKIDVWVGHLSRDVIYGQMDDDYQDWVGGPAVTSLVGGAGDGFHEDETVVSGKDPNWPYAPTYTEPEDGSYDNLTTLVITGSSPAESVDVPMYIIPGSKNYYYIKQSDVDNGTAKLVTAVDENGVLTYDGGTIDPNTDPDYQRTGDPVTGGDGPKCIPSYIAAPLVNGRADIICQANYTGTGWIVEYKRALKTSDTLKQDVDFSSLEDQPFGIAIFNKSDNQHAIQPNLTLKFKK